MNTNATRFPLAWPHGWPRTKMSLRRRAPFRDHGQPVSVFGALSRLEREIRLLDARDELLSTNVPMRLDGRPRSDQGEPNDRGAAVYFTLKGKPVALACDKWDRVADNIAAMAQHIDALRRIDRYGVGRLEQAFGGYTAIPAHVLQWWDVLGIDSTATLAEAENAYYARAKEWHPDAGGSHEAMAKLNAARDEARKALVA